MSPSTLFYVPRQCGPPKIGDTIDVYSADSPAWSVGTGPVVGFLNRKPIPTTYRGNLVPSFRIGQRIERARPDRNVHIPIVANLTFSDDLAYTPRYPDCPDCGGTIVWTLDGRGRPSGECAGYIPRDLTVPRGVPKPIGYGSCFTDSRYPIVIEDLAPETTR